MITPSRSFNDSSSRDKVPGFRRGSFGLVQELVVVDAPAAESSSLDMTASPSKWFVNAQGTALPVLPGQSLFLPRYPIELTKEFHDTFCQNPAALPPATLRNSIWWEVEGQARFEDLQAKAERKWMRACKEHKRLVRDIEAENTEIRLANKRLRNTYETDLCSRAAKAVFERMAFAIKLWRDSLEEQVKLCLYRGLTKPCNCDFSLWWDTNWLSKNECISDPLGFSIPIKFGCKSNARPGWAFLSSACPRSVSPGQLASSRKLATAFFLANRIPGINDAVEETMTFLHSVAKRKWTCVIGEPEMRDFLASIPLPPTLPAPCYQPLAERPPKPTLCEPDRPQPPEDCFDPEMPADGGPLVLRGTRLATLAENRTFVRHMLFADGFVRPYWMLGGVPAPFFDDDASDVLVMGGTGSGKTKMLRLMMSALLPLTNRQRRRIVKRTPAGCNPLPKSFHEWSRDRTFQAVVYNAKRENISFLAQLGFDVEHDLINMDPEDQRCTAWNIAADLQDRNDIKEFSRQLVPEAPGDVAEENAEFWKGQARDLIEAVIVCFTNAAFEAGKAPSWNLQDLVSAFHTEETFATVLQHHDTPDAVMSRFLNIAPNQKDSGYTSVRQYMNRFDVTAAEWAEAERLGRSVSLKEWALSGGGTVLVLPNTMANSKANQPLNQLLFMALTKLFLTAKFSHYRDAQGVTQARRRYVFLDEIGSAGKLFDLERVMTEGRTYGVTVVMGLHQLSQMKKTYGENDMETILGNCPYNLLLKQSDRKTAEWIANRIGKQIALWTKHSFTCGSVIGTSVTNTSTVTDVKGTANNTSVALNQAQQTNTSSTHGVSSAPAGCTTKQTTSISETNGNGKNSGVTITAAITEQKSHAQASGTSETKNESKSKSKSIHDELKEQFAISPEELTAMPHTRTTGMIGVISITPYTPTCRADFQLDDLKPELENPGAKDTVQDFVEWSDKRHVQRLRSWTQYDFERLCIAPTAQSVVTSVRIPKRSPLTVQGEIPSVLQIEALDAQCVTKEATRFPDSFPFEVE